MFDTTEEIQDKKLVAIRIDGLFGNLTYYIPLNKESGITILAGPNGCGKTTILKLLEALSGLDLGNLLDVPFRQLVLGFDDETELSVIRRDASKMLLRRNPSGGELRVKAKKISNMGTPIPPIIKQRGKVFKNECELQFDLRWHGGAKIEESYTTDVLNPELDENVFSRSVLAERLTLPSWLEEDIAYNVHLISTDRLVKPVFPPKPPGYERSYILTENNEEQELNNTPYALMIEMYAEDFRQKVEEAREKMAATAQELDQSFPFRLLERTKMGVICSASAMKDRFKNNAEKRQRLKMAGIIAEFNADNKDGYVVEEDTAGTNGVILSIYAEDEARKLGVFDELLQQTELFFEIINSRLINKKMVPNDEVGFEIVNSYDGESAPLHTLSSGEQHEINLFFNLIFHMKPRSLIMIDEPELSMHIGWQLRFIDDLKKVRQLNGCEFLLATHSPAIIDDHWDYVVELEV